MPTAPPIPFTVGDFEHFVKDLILAKNLKRHAIHMEEIRQILDGPEERVEKETKESILRYSSDSFDNFAECYVDNLIAIGRFDREEVILNLRRVEEDLSHYFERYPVLKDFLGEIRRVL